MDATLPRHTAHSKAKVQEAALNEREPADTHSKIIGYLLWIFGFTGWRAPLGILGIHRFYLRKWFTGLVYLLTGGLVLLGVLYDFWTLNSQVSEENRSRGGGR
jgi:TM2 domain-containing membrane protein YozV